MSEPIESDCCGASDGELKPLGIKEIFEHMVAAEKAWREAGYPVVSAAVYHHRLRICRACPKDQYRWFQCKHCRCVVYSKAKLATEDCPFKLWP